jgi:hypothetical protein
MYFFLITRLILQMRNFIASSSCQSADDCR